MNREAVQRHRINRVINFVHANLHEDINLERMADVACLSKFHFLRTFDARLNQTPLRFLDRIRLERAARQLVFTPDAAVGRIAENCGYRSHHNFSRAFKRHFGSSPIDFRLAPIAGNPITPAMPPLQEDSLPDIRIEDRSETSIAYLRHFGAYRRDTGGIRQAIDTILGWTRNRGIDPAAAKLVGLCPDNRRITPTPFCIYDIGVVLDEDVQEDDVVSTLVIPAGRYAVAEVSCANNQVLTAWEWLSSHWRTFHAEPYEQRWSYEVFHIDRQGNHGPMVGLDLCLRLSA